MPSRKLAKSRRGRNRHDRTVRIAYWTNGGLRSVRTVVLYSVRIRFDGLVIFDGYDASRRSELSFSGENVEWLADAEAGCALIERRRIMDFLLCLHRRQRRPVPALHAFAGPGPGTRRPRGTALRAHGTKWFNPARRPKRFPDPKFRPH